MDLAKKLNVIENVMFLGYISQINSILAQIDIVVLSSFTEGFPLTPIEAFVAGKPVIGTAVGGTVEIINEGINGFLVESGDFEAISRRIVELCIDKAKYDLL